jgi:hypothetical protein
MDLQLNEEARWATKLHNEKVLFSSPAILWIKCQFQGDAMPGYTAFLSKCIVSRAMAS